MHYLNELILIFWVKLPAYSLAVSVSTTRSSPRSLLFPIFYFGYKFLKEDYLYVFKCAFNIKKFTKSKLIFFSSAWFFNSFSHLSMLSNDLRSQMSKIRNAPNAFLKYLDYFVKILHVLLRRLTIDTVDDLKRFILTKLI